MGKVLQAELINLKNWVQRAHLSEISSLFFLVMWKMREGDLSLSSVTGSVIYPFLIHVLSFKLPLILSIFHGP